MWVLWNAVLTQGVVIAGVGGVLFLAAAVKQQQGLGSPRVDRAFIAIGTALIALGALSGIASAYLAIGQPA